MMRVRWRNNICTATNDNQVPLWLAAREDATHLTELMSDLDAYPRNIKAIAREGI